MTPTLPLQSATARVLASSLDRNRLFAALVAIGFANGVVIRIAEGLKNRELPDLVMNTFDISAIVWIALSAGIALLLGPPWQPVTRADQVVAAVAGATFLVPVAPLSWIGLTGLALYMAATSSEGSFARRGAWIVLAITVPMLWSRAAFQLLSDPILAFDATLVGWVVGTEQVGNAIASSDGSGYLWIAPACSSLTNVSLAILCWVLFKQVFYRLRPFSVNGWCVLACAAVVAINVTRLSLIASNNEYFDLVHGVMGATIANWATFAAIVGICALGVRDGVPAQR
jgi:hypothetical protein